MLEGLAAWVLNNYLGKYVHLNADQLSIALLSGKVELENLPLKKDAFRHLGLPVQIKVGFIGKVQLQIPVRQIRSAPWLISIEQLYLVASPLPLDEWDGEREQLARHELKMSSLDNIEAKWRFEKDIQDTNSSYYASSYSSWYSYGAGLVSEIIENLQMKIQDVHIRYEDAVSISGKSVGFGVTIDSLTAQSCDSNWHLGFIQTGKSDYSYKIMELQNFSVYWMTLGTNDLLSELTVAELAEVMCKNKTKKYLKNYIIPSVTCTAHVKRNRTTQPLRSSNMPRITFDLSLEEVPLTLVDWQYNQIVTCIKGLENIGRLRSYRQYKPSTSIKEDPFAWWCYAISCFYPGKQPAICRPKPTWETALLRAKQNVQYVQVYMKLLLTPSLALTATEKNVKELVEWERDYEELKDLREVAMNLVKLPDRVEASNKPSRGRSMLESWFPQWIGWYSSTSFEANTSSSEAKQLEGEILQVLEDSVENNSILKRDAVFGQFNFCLKRGVLNLCTQHENNEIAPMLELQFKNLSLNILSKPRTSAYLVELSLGALNLRDKITHNSLFPTLIGPPGQDRTTVARGKGYNLRLGTVTNGITADDSSGDNLFFLAYEKKPQNSACDRRLTVVSKCLDVVYHPEAIKWLTNFVCLPHQKDITQSKIEAMKMRTKKEFIKNWEQILEGRVLARTTWELKLDISAPQIIFVEDFTDQNSAMAVIDFGRLQLCNNTSKNEPSKPDYRTKESEEDDMFLTPCSTPPASEASSSGELTKEPNSEIENITDAKLSETMLHNKLYDCYSLELTDMQILIGKPKENWRYALNKGSSTLHVLDRFSILLQIERRVVYTSDPLYPSLTLNANLPKLNMHLNEGKIISARNLLFLITTTGLPSPFKGPENVFEENNKTLHSSQESISIDTSIEMSRILMVQFTIDQMSLELQSRGRCIAELQVSGVKVAFTKRSVDMSITLSVHSLLLADALQTFGHDFELLVASHKHVGMDSMSGSLRDSEPTSPLSPASPDPNTYRTGATSPLALSQALSSLATSPEPKYSGIIKHSPFDSEALITIEVVLVSGNDPMQIANIQFNNLDIIANQETIVELMGFIQRVFPKSQRQSKLNFSSVVAPSVRESTESLLDDTNSSIGVTEITFDFHRLNVLLLRGVLKDGLLTGKKICTATMTEAKIQAVVSNKLEVEGSLGGLQVLDLTPEGQMHQRIISVGRDPLAEVPHPIYAMSAAQDNDRVAFNFHIVRNLERCNQQDAAQVTVRMASLWYTHSPQFVVELQSCATEFKQYLSNLARSIKSAATDMALGLVHAKAEALAQTLNKRLPSSIYGSSFSFSECPSPNKRNRRRSSSATEASGFYSARDTVPQTPYSPEDDEDFAIQVVLDIELDSPVLVLPRTSNSTEVFVAHLGRINVSNNRTDETLSNTYPYEFMDSHKEHYTIEIKDMNVYSLNTAFRRGTGLSTKPDILYNCKTLAKPILHDTLLQLKIVREINKSSNCQSDSDSNILFGDEIISDRKHVEIVDVMGSIVTALKISLVRAQYEQLLDTLQWLTSTPVLSEAHGINVANVRPQSALTNISEEDLGVTTLNMDPHVRAKLFPSLTTTVKPKTPYKNIALKISFEVPMFTVELRNETPVGEQAVVDLSFRDFIFNYEKSSRYETNIQISLRSIHMEDLLQPEDSKQRTMVISSDTSTPANSSCVSRSCPDVMYQPHLSCLMHNSLPDHLEATSVFGNNLQNNYNHTSFASPCPCTPPPSPSQGKNNKPEKKLVLISTLLVDPSVPNFEKTYNSIQKSTSVDFNCLDLVINVPSWLVVIDFFTASSSTGKYGSLTNLNATLEDKMKSLNKSKTVTNITVCSLTVVLVKPKVDIAKANISNLDVTIKTNGLDKEVEGRLGSISLLDLTLHGQLYRERFTTAGNQALQFKYIRHSANRNEDGYDAQLTLEMVSVIVVYTKRFVAEIQAFFDKFTKTQQTVIKGIQAATSSQLSRDDPLRLSMIIKVGSPMILIPISSRSENLLVIDLRQLSVTNTFKYSGEAGTLHYSHKENSRKCLLEVMNIDLEKLDLYTGSKENEMNVSPNKYPKNSCFKLGNLFVVKKGPSLLTKKFQLKLQYEKNLNKNVCHSVPDSSIYGYLSSLDCAIDLHQYKLIRGLLEFNLGEDTEKIFPTVSTNNTNSESNVIEVWTVTSLKLDMENVSLRLIKTHKAHSPITCINFIKSNLTIESYSNFSQDIDLVSQEILIIDTRFHGSENIQGCNVFTNILQPIKDTVKENDLVQVEVHSRKRKNHSKVTILLNNMRLMAIFDWWEMFQGFLFQEIESVASSPEHHSVNKLQAKSVNTFELKLNVTNSELVVVEDSSQWDSNAVILKSTTVLKYRPNYMEKPVSCSLNNCEMFSCILGKENETALSIIDPINLYIDLNKDRILEVQLQFLIVRLSYHDMCMFSQILNSLPKQLISTEPQESQVSNLKNNIATLSSLGFKTEDCKVALEKCENKLDDSALWLTHNATPLDGHGKSDRPISINAVEIKANCISICIIDDCGDSDVPLLELSFSELELSQLLLPVNVTNAVYPTGCISCKLTCDYYSRLLSGWEPALEPWRCRILWEKAISQDLLRNRVMVKVESEDTLNFNITSTIIELYKQVKENWTQDYIKMKNTNDKSVVKDKYRRRAPFIPFALKNDTGCPLKFSTHISDVNYSSSLIHKSDDNWLTVDTGETVSFSFSARGKLRHQNTHKMKLHQILVKVDGWQCVEPVTVDKVGVYFRDTPAERENRTMDIPLARIVFDISLEGSARKLVTVRSALLLTNHLPQAVEVKLESRLPNDVVMQWVPSKILTIEPKNTFAIPLAHAHSEISVRPYSNQNSIQYTYCTQSLTWAQMPTNADKIYELATCHSHKGYNYRFCAEIIKQKVQMERVNRIEQPAHRIVLLPTIKILNLLTTDIDYTIHEERGHIEAGSYISLTNVDPDKSVEIEIRIENFKTCTTIAVPAGGSDFNCQIKLEDSKQRKLYLLAEIKTNETAKLKVSISAPYWIINKTGLPLVFRQSETSIESAGQFDEHEQARMVAPLLFSFLDQDASHSINARVGRKVIWDGSPQWCSNFHLRKGTQYRKLHVTMRDGKSDMVFIVGIEVRSGRGKYRNTQIITISPRYQLYNKSSYQLAFAQACTVKNVDFPCKKSCLKAMPNSHMPFHWTKLEKDQLLCVSIQDVPDCHWSGGLRIDTNYSMHVNIRDSNGRVYFLRLEVVLQGATFYIVFTDADTLPPPIRVDNFSEVSIKFGQACYVDIMHSTARAHSSVPYAWDETTKDHIIRLTAPGGVSHSYNINILGPAPGLTYENFIYIAFVGTFKTKHGVRDPCDVESQELVLDVYRNKVILAQKIPGERSQLWRMTSEGYLHHEGSSPPSHPGAKRSKENIHVLDIENTAPQPNTFCKLVLRRIDPRRQSTQKWRFTEEGRLCCDHYNMCVQPEDGFYGLRPGSAAVLGLPQPVCHKVTDKGIPIEQAIERQRFRPGSGFLSVTISMDGPTQVVIIKDIKGNKITKDNKEWSSVSSSDWSNSRYEEDETPIDNIEYQFILSLKRLGLSLVCMRNYEELLYASFSKIIGEAVLTPQNKQFCISVKDMQIDNQLLDATVPVVNYVTPSNSRTNNEAEHLLPAIDFKAEMLPKLNEKAILFKHLILRLKKMTVIIEEKLLLKLFGFIGFHFQEEELVNRDEADYETQRLLTEVSAAHAKRYYFGVLKLIPDQIRLSVKTATKLSKDLQNIKRMLGLTLIQFEDAAIDLEEFERKHPFETIQFLQNSIIKHFKEGLMWQAGFILFSVDFIGSPRGLVNDVSEGFSGFIHEGNVGTLVKNVAHGLSNSTAKLTESISDGLGRISMDDYHEEMRHKIRQVESGRSTDHLLAGIKGLGFGVLGGATGIFKQVYEGASTDGFPGFASGFGKGVLGLFMKPVVGVLDLASETARALRDSSRSKDIPERKRLPRCVQRCGGVLPRYSSKQSQGQQFLYYVNQKNYDEKLVAYQVLGSASEDLLCIVSNKIIRIVTSTRVPELTPVIECPLSDLEICNVITEKDSTGERYYIEIVMRYAGMNAALVSTDPIKRPRVRCKTSELADTVAQQINYAKRLYVEDLYTLSDDKITVLED